MNCKHGIDSRTCSICNETTIEQQMEKKKLKANLLMQTYVDTKTFDNFGELWSDEEITVVYDELNSVPKYQLRDKIIEVALKLGRTRNSVKWMFKHIFSEKQDLHRGKEVIKFVEELTL